MAIQQILVGIHKDKVESTALEVAESRMEAIPNGMAPETYLSRVLSQYLKSILREKRIRKLRETIVASEPLGETDSN